MKAEIISIGTEIMMGEITDTNAAFIASQLPALGIELHWVSQVGDDPARMMEVFRRGWDRSDVIFTTGGLGPTADDITRESIAELLGEKMEVKPELVADLTRMFAGRNQTMPQSNLKQATLIPSSTALPNSMGTAPGWWVERDGRIIIMMPGPPREMTNMWDNVVLPKLKTRGQSTVILSKTFKTFGLGEAAVGEMVFPLYSIDTNPSLGVYAKQDGIHVRITAKTQDRAVAESMLTEGGAKIRDVLQKYIWGQDNETLESITGELLKSKGLKLATSEVASGGLLAEVITEVPGSASYYKGGFIAHANGSYVSCGVPQELMQHGGSSAEVCQAMAEAARARFGADIGLSITEMDNNAGGRVFVGIDTGSNKKAIGRNFFGYRVQLKRRIVTAALEELRKSLSGID